MEQERLKLQRQLEGTRDRLRRLRKTLQDQVEFNIEDIDPDIYEREKTLALIKSLERKAESLERALVALDRGLYGLCERCGQAIDPARLEVLPEATLCIGCQAEVEWMRKRGLA
jgi:RNA polymerase-binding transcription factor DksA